MSFATANVGSLYTGPDGHRGKLNYLRSQMISFKLNFLGLQETRGHDAFTETDGIIRIATGAERGCFGVELWVSTAQPYAFTQNRPQFLKAAHFAVASRSPRHLLVQVCPPGEPFWILVAHAPQSGRPQVERQQWWDQMNELLNQYVSGDLWVLFDANARTGSQDGRHIFVQDDSSSVNTPFLRNFLEFHDLALPCTSNQHVGSTDTWTSPDGTLSARIDYVAVPIKHATGCTFSSVLHDFDLGNSHDDHSAVGLQMQWKSWALAPMPTSLPSKPHRPCMWRTSDLIHCLPTLRDAPLPAWDTDVESQVDGLQQHIHRALAHCHPGSLKAAKKPYIDEEIWLKRAEKLRLKKHIREIGRRMKTELLFKSWQTWVSDRQFEPSPYELSLKCARLKYTAQLKTVAVDLRTLLKAARSKALSACLEQISPDAPFCALLEQLRPLIGPTNPNKRKIKSLPFLLDANGQPLTDPEGQLNRWIEFFANMEGGKRLHPETLRDHWLHALRALPAVDLNDALPQIPSLADLEAALRQAPLRKATGPDHIPAELCRLAPVELAKQLYPLLLKTLLHGQEPWQWKGGRLTPIFKGKGSQGEVSSHRSILVSNHFGKVIHKCIRSKTYTFFADFIHGSQLGGRRKIPVSIGVHFARAFLRWKAREGEAAALLFMDLREAFYRLFRPLALQSTMTDEDLYAAFARLGMPITAIDELRYHLRREPCALQQAGIPPLSCRAITSIHQCTWFQLPGQHDVVETTMGSRPGDSFADTVFTFIYARVLKTLEHRLAEADLLTVVPGGHRGFHEDPSPVFNFVPPHTQIGPTWMDDTCIFIAAPDANTLHRKMGPVTSLTLDVCREFGLSPNLAVGKTEILVSPKGAGTRSFKNTFFGPVASGFFDVVSEHQVDKVKVVSNYKNLGGQISFRSTTTKEIKQRLSIAHRAFADHRQLLYQNKHLSLQQRTQAFNSLVLSKLSYGMESWILDTAATQKYFHAGVMRLYRRLLKLRHDDHRSDASILAALRLPAPEVLLRRARLRYVGLLFQCDSSVDWGLLGQDLHWVDLVKGDMLWLWQQLQHSSGLQDPRLHIAQWGELLQYSPRFWKRLVNRAVAHAIGQAANEQVVLSLHLKAQAVLRVHDFNIPDVARSEPQHLSQVFGCMCCRKRFRSRAGQGAHFFKTHHIVAESRLRFDTTYCSVCLREFHSAARMKAHLRYSDHCLQTLRGQGILCTPLPGIGSIADAETSRQVDGQRLSQQGFGPLREAVHRLRGLDLYHQALADALLERLLDCADPEQMLLAFQEEILRTAASWETTCATLQHVNDSYGEQEATITGISCDAFRGAIAQLQSTDFWPFLVDPLDQPMEQDLPYMEDYFADICARDRGLRTHSPDVPRPFGKLRYILHAYSGRRRYGDVQFFLDKAQTQHDSFIIQILSVDIIIDRDFGDLMNVDTQHFWVSMIQQRFVVGIIAGPPCNTFSKVRKKKIEDEHRGHGPRAVRSPQHPWALPSLTLRELSQVFAGNSLLAFAFLALYELVGSGGIGFLEHAADTEREEDVSIWKIPVIAALLRFEPVTFQKVTQGHHGFEGAKATGLLGLRLPDLATQLKRWRLADWHVQGQTTGRAADGSFHSAKLKEYPPSAFDSSLGQFPIDTSIEPPQDFRALCNRLVSSTRGETIGLDYHCKDR
eukprot:Skav214043  [mRNA]  locus=scaffold2017:237221:242224:+ [translate_table: standard]